MVSTPRGRPKGPVPKPTALKILQGVHKKDPDRVNHREPKPSGVVEAPAFLTEKAREIWDDLAPSMIACGVLTIWDVPIFAEVCESLVITRIARRNVMLEAAGQYVPAPGTASPVNSWVKSVLVVANLAGRYGMTPADRSRLIMQENEAVKSGSRDLLSG